MNQKKKIYLFLNGAFPSLPDQKPLMQYAAVSEDGHCLGHSTIPAELPSLAWEELQKSPEFQKNYKEYYPDGYELVLIKDINAPENKSILDHIRKVTSDRVREHFAVKSSKGN